MMIADFVDVLCGCKRDVDKLLHLLQYSAENTLRSTQSQYRHVESVMDGIVEYACLLRNSITVSFLQFVRAQILHARKFEI